MAQGHKLWYIDVGYNLQQKALHNIQALYFTHMTSLLRRLLLFKVQRFESIHKFYSPKTTFDQVKCEYLTLNSVVMLGAIVQPYSLERLVGNLFNCSSEIHTPIPLFLHLSMVF